MAEHLTAHTRGGDRSLLWPERASWLWGSFGRNLSGVRSCLLMEDHPHVVAAPGNLDAFRRSLGAFSKRFGVRFDLCEPSPAHSEAIAVRMSRYGLLNPVRAGLVDDPFVWPWSTARDSAGAIARPWVRREARGGQRRSVLNSLRDAVGPRFELPSPKRIVVARPRGLLMATASALRTAPNALRQQPASRRLLVQAAARIGRPDTEALAQLLDVHPRTVRRYLHEPETDPASIDAILLCLGDHRLHHHGFG